jgi:hypothetical protein
VEGAPNALAWLALALCLPVSILAVSMRRAAVAVPIIILAGQMFLPTMIEFDAPLIPPLNKDVLVPLGVLIGCLLFRRKALAGGKPFQGYDLFIAIRLVGLLGTYLTNGDPLRFGPVLLPAVGFFDFFASAIKELLFWWPPFFLGRMVIRTSDDLRTLFRIVVGAGVVYTFFLAIELVASPQLNRWIYGYHQTNFIMSIRGGGYRPMVFMRHGLNVAFFMAITVLAATALGRIRDKVFGIRARLLAVYLLTVLALCHSLGALLYASVGVPLLWFTKPKAQARVAAVLALLAFSYPIARAAGVIPVDDINNLVLEKFGEDRAGSLALRLSEEGWLMERALKRIVFGWGGYSRSFRHDPITGANTSITDGVWAIEIGSGGAFGFISLFGLLLYPAWRGRHILRKVESREDKTLVACLAFIAAIYGVELIPNSSIDPYLTFLVGVLAGVARRGLEPDPAAVFYPSEPEEAPARAAPVAAG